MIKKVVIAGKFDGEDIFVGVGFSNNKYFLDSDGLYIKPAKMSSKKMKLFDTSNKCLCNNVLSEDCDIYLENNQTPFELVQYDGGMLFYNK